MTGILALLAFALAFVFHAYGFAPNHWFDWTGLVITGLALLTLHMLGVGTRVPRG